MTLAPERAVGIWQKIRTPPRTSSRAGSGVKAVQLTLKQAVQRGLAGNPTLKRLRARVRTRRAEIGEARQLLNPSLRLSELRLDELVDGKGELEMALRFRFRRPGTTSARTHQAELRTRRAEADEKDGVRRLIARITIVFLRLTVLKRDLALVDQQVVLREKQIALIRSRVAENAATALELTRAKVPHAQALDVRATLRGRLLRLRQELKLLMGAPPELRVQTVSMTLPVTKLKVSVKSLVQRALKARPELAAAAARVAEAHAEVFLAKQQRIPWFRFAQLTYDFRPNLDPLRFGFAVSIDIPLFSLNNGGVAARQARVLQRRTEEQALIAEIVARVHAWTRRLASRRAQLTQITTTLLPATAQAVKATRAAISAGTLDALRASRVELQHLRAQRSHLAALLAYHEARARLEAEVGG